MENILTYKHTRSLFIRNEFKPFVNKYFKNIRYLGTESGNWNPKIEISNWDKIKDILPKSYKPDKVTRAIYSIKEIKSYMDRKEYPLGNGDIVLGFDEILKKYIEVRYRSDSNRFFEFPYIGAVYPLYRIHKWKFK